MDIELYTVDFRDTDLTNPPTNGLTVSGNFRGDVSVTSPLIEITRNVDVIPYNFAFIPALKRYYFVSNKSVVGNVWTLHCREAYLITWRENLLNTRLFCSRSSNRYNEDLTDTLYPARVTVENNTLSAVSPWVEVRNGTYIIAISSGGNAESHIGTNCYYVLNNDEMTAFMSALMSTDIDFSISGVAESITRTMINPLQYIQSCIWLPIEIDATLDTVDSIDFGWWSAPTTAKVLRLEDSTDTLTELTTTFSVTNDFIAADREYLKYPPYSSIRLNCYPFGIIQLPDDILSQVMRGNNLICRIKIDHLTGMGTLLLEIQGVDAPLSLTTAQIGVEIPVGQILQDFAGSAISALSGVGMIAAGNVLGGAAGIRSAIDQATPNVSTVGTTGGFAQLMQGEAWKLIRTYRTLIADRELLGEPCCQEYLLNALTGYAQFEKADITGPMLLAEKDALKSLLEGGIYIA